MTLRSGALAALVVVSAVCLALAGCSGATTTGNSAAQTVTVYVSGDTNVKDLWQNTLIPGFQQAQSQYSVRMAFSEHGANDVTTLAKLGAAVKSNSDPGEDLIDGDFTQAATSGWTEKVSTGNVANLKNVDPKLLLPVESGSVPYRASAVVLAYDSKTVANPPTTLDALLAWIKANPGKFTYNSPPTGGSGLSFVTTVLDKYVPAADRDKMVNGYDPALNGDWDQGLRALKDLGPSIYQHVYPNGNQNVLNLLAKGQISIAPVWSDQALSSLAAGLLPPTVKLAQISDPSFTGGPAYLTIPKTATHKAGALALANWLLEPAQQAAVAKAMSGFPVIPISQLPADVQGRFADTDPNTLRPPYSDQTAADLNKLWQQNVPG